MSAIGRLLPVVEDTATGVHLAGLTGQYHRNAHQLALSLLLNSLKPNFRALPAKPCAGEN